MIPSVYHAPFPYMFRSPYKGAPEDADLYYFAELEALFDQMVMPDDVAGILIETVVGEGGYLVPTKRWLQMVRALCDKHGIMLILDEVQSGMGRTGKMWAYEHFDVVPDIMTAAKGLASGMPVAAVVADRALMDKWAPGVARRDLRWQRGRDRGRGRDASKSCATRICRGMRPAWARS